MDNWSWGPNTVTAVATVVTAVVGIAGLIYAIVETRRAKHTERPDVSGRPKSFFGVGPTHWLLDLETTVRNPSRRTIQLQAITIEHPPGAGFQHAGDVATPTSTYSDPIGPLKEATHKHRVSIPNELRKGELVFCFKIACPIGGDIAQESLRIAFRGPEG